MKAASIVGALVLIICCSCCRPGSSQSLEKPVRNIKKSCDYGNLAGGWIRKEYAASIVKKETPARAFEKCKPVSGLIVSESSDSLMIICNFHDRELCRIDVNDGCTWYIKHFFEAEEVYTLEMASNDEVILEMYDRYYRFIRYPRIYDENEMPSGLVNDSIFAGKYDVLYPDSGTVSFAASGSVSGLAGYDSYVVGFDFVAVGLCDYLLLYNTSDRRRDSFYWSIREDTLTLRKYDFEGCEDVEKREVVYTLRRVDERQ